MISIMNSSDIVVGEFSQLLLFSSCFQLTNRTTAMTIISSISLSHNHRLSVDKLLSKDLVNIVLVVTCLLYQLKIWWNLIINDFNVEFTNCIKLLGNWKIQSSWNDWWRLQLTFTPKISVCPCPKLFRTSNFFSRLFF